LAQMMSRGGVPRTAPNNFAFQQQPQAPAGLQNQMQAAQQQMQSSMNRASAIPVATPRQAQSAVAAPPAGMQQAFNQFQSGSYQAAPNNFSFQQPTQRPANLAQQMQAAQQAMQPMAVQSSQAQQLAAPVTERPATQLPSAPLQQAYDQYRSGVYQPRPNNFGFQQNQAGAPIGIGTAIADMQRMFGNNSQNNIGSLIYGYSGGQQQQRTSAVQQRQMAMQRNQNRMRLF
jgi:hypothetical protein